MHILHINVLVMFLLITISGESHQVEQPYQLALKNVSDMRQIG